VVVWTIPGTYISSYKHVSNFQWVWRYSCLNFTHKTPYKRYEGKTKDLLIAFIGYVNDLNKLQQFKVSIKKSWLIYQPINALNEIKFMTLIVYIFRHRSAFFWACYRWDEFKPVGRDSSVVIATGCGLDGPGIGGKKKISGAGEIFRTRPDRSWGPPSLPHNGNRVFRGGKAAGTWRWPPTPSSTEVKETSTFSQDLHGLF
jgi:hypothetical protein